MDERAAKRYRSWAYGVAQHHVVFTFACLFVTDSECDVADLHKFDYAAESCATPKVVVGPGPGLDPDLVEARRTPPASSAFYYYLR